MVTWDGSPVSWGQAWRAAVQAPGSLSWNRVCLGLRWTVLQCSPALATARWARNPALPSPCPAVLTAVCPVSSTAGERGPVGQGLN